MKQKQNCKFQELQDFMGVLRWFFHVSMVKATPWQLCSLRNGRNRQCGASPTRLLGSMDINGRKKWVTLDQHFFFVGKNPKILKIHWWDDVTFYIKKNVTQWTTPKILKIQRNVFWLFLTWLVRKHVDNLSLKLVMGCCSLCETQQQWLPATCQHFPSLIQKQKKTSGAKDEYDTHLKFNE